jgi:2-dehydro-3-deoxyphosphogluconate aldolase/(4S)-4-hydroxy-2-oxoglutarate aldolase
VVPVCGLLSPDEAGPLAAALVAGGLPLIEVTLRTPWSLSSLEEMARQPGILVGAGTVRTPAQMESAVRAGASFIVSPCLPGDLAAAAADLDVPFLPGVTTPSEIQRACDLGMSTVKFFPAESSGGVTAVRALAQPFHDVTFVPTGGITADTAPSYLAIPQVAAVGGGWMVPTPPRQAHDWDSVTQAISAVAALVRDRT